LFLRPSRHIKRVPLELFPFDSLLDVVCRFLGRLDVGVLDRSLAKFSLLFFYFFHLF